MFESLLNGAIYFGAFIAVLSVIVFVHEYGHYFVARLNKVKVEAFSIGFGKELFGWDDKAGTRWKICLIPMGGYVKMLGDSDASSSTVDQSTAAQPDSFPSKNVYQRMAIVVAGPAANFLFAIIVFALFFAIYGKPFAPAIVSEIVAESAAENAGLQSGDRIISIDGRNIESFQELSEIVRVSPGQELALEIERNDIAKSLIVVPELKAFEDRFGVEHQIGQLGVRSTEIEFRQSSPFAALGLGVAETYNIAKVSLVSLYEIVVGQRGTEGLGGPLRIAQISGETAKSENGFLGLVHLIALLSVGIGLVNLFPIPVLDGGHLVLYTIEALRGRPVTERTQEIAFRVGIVMVLSLMVFATFNDLVQLNIF